MRRIFIALLIASSCQADDAEIREAIQKAIPVIEAGSAGSADERTCFTCHSQGMPILALKKAQSLGFEVDSENLDRQVEHTFDHISRGKLAYVKGKGQGGKVDTAGMALWALDEAGHEPDDVTEAVVDYLIGWQADKPYWTPQTDRPPSEGSQFTSTFLALLAFEYFRDEAKAEEIQERRERAQKWIVEAEIEETEDAVFRLRALDLLEAEAKTATEQLLSLQAENGGWAQQPGMDAEAYSTGSALAALLATNSIDSKHPACEAAISFLLEAQLEDGSWKIETRSRPIQKHYESGFPHGKDQFISCAGSCWAVLALLRAIE